MYRPIAGSLTEARGQKANIHVCREMLELCQIINSEGYPQSKEHPELKVILFGELFNVSLYLEWKKKNHFFISPSVRFSSIYVFNFLHRLQIYTCINDKLVGLLLRARKHKFIEFEGEVLFQRRDDDVPIFMLKSVAEIKQILNDKIEEVRRSASPNPQATTLLMK